MREAVSYNTSYSLCAFTIVVMSFVFLFTRKDMRRKNSRLFFGVLVLNMLAVILDMLSCHFNSNPGEYSLSLRTVVDGAYLIVHISLSPLITWYFINFTGMNHKIKSWTKVAYCLPYLLLSVEPVLIPQLRPYVYYYDASGVFRLGKYFFFTVPMGGIFYCFIIAYVAILNRNRLSREQKNAIIFLVIFCSLPAFIQNVALTTERFNLFFESVGIFIVLLTVDNQNWVYNEATQTYNRLTMQRHLQGDMDNGIPFDIIILTISRNAYFQTASKGNEEFQALMGSIGNYLKGLHGRLDVYYCERGSFVIPLYKDSPWRPKDLIDELSRRFTLTWTTRFEIEREVKIPIRLVDVNIPSDAATMEDVLRLIDFPYDAETNNPLIVEASSLKMAEEKSLSVLNSDVTESGDTGVPELPEELSNMMDTFVGHIQELTPMERKVMLYYLNGYEITDLPELLGVTINTVRKHNRSIYHKLNVGSKEELMIYLDILDRCGRLEPIENALKEENPDKELKKLSY